MGAWPLVNLYRFPAFNAFVDPVTTMRTWIPASAGSDGVHWRIAAPIFAMMACAIPCSLVPSRAKVSLSIV